MSGDMLDAWIAWLCSRKGQVAGWVQGIAGGGRQMNSNRAVGSALEPWP